MNILIITLTMLFYLNQSAEVVIGTVKFNDINSIEIDESVKNLSNTAKITLPRNYEKLNGRPVLDYIHVGDKVSVSLGYDDDLSEEYTGYVRQISSDVPIEIECDEMYPLRQNNLIKSYPSVSLKQLLRDITAGTPIKNIESPNADLGKYLIDNASTFAVLMKLKEELGLFSRMRGDTLYVGFAWDWQPNITANHTYTIHENVRKNNLKFKRKSDFNVKVRVNIHNQDGSVETVEYGSKEEGAAIQYISVGDKSTTDASAIAQAHYQQAVYDGYTGNIIGFGIPKVHAGDALIIADKTHPEREGAYLVERTNILYNLSGIKRVNELAYKI